MLSYYAVTKCMIVGLCVSYSMSAYAMKKEEYQQTLINPVSNEHAINISNAIPASTLPNISIQSNTYFHTIRESTRSMLPSKTKIAAASTLLFVAGWTGYMVGSMCQECAHELESTKAYAQELDNAFDTCVDTTTHLAHLLEQCVESVDSIKDLIIEVCVKK